MAANTGADEIWVEVDNTPPELSVNELTDNPTLDEPQYRINGTVETGAILIVNGIEISHNGTFEYTTNVTEGTNTIIVTATDAAGNTATWTKIRMVDTDLLPDYYEINVTGTDPLDGDSDSLFTLIDESDNGIKDGNEDLDSDGDGLTDYDEIYGMRTAMGLIFRSGLSGFCLDQRCCAVNDLWLNGMSIYLNNLS